MKGWLLVQPYDEYLEATHQRGAAKPETFVLLNNQLPPGAEGVYPISYAIKSQQFLKLFAENAETKIGANFNIENNVPDGDNGAYEITGGRLGGTGTFVNVAAKEEAPDFGKFFICHSNTPNGLHLRWEVGLDEIVDGENLSFTS
jgi:hypothetical protein